MFQKKLLHRIQEIDSQLVQIDSQLPSSIAGNFYIVQNPPYYKWFYNDGTKTSLISQKDVKTAEHLAVQKYLILKRQELQQEKSSILTFLKSCPTSSSKSEELLLHPGYARLLSPFFQPQQAQHQEWINAPYEKNPKYPEQLIHKTPSGIYVRSKSEVLIAMSLYTKQIPFRYECALSLKQAKIYPDFTILHPQTNLLYYWEHFGMISQNDYRKAAFSKLELYASNEIYPSIQLITTYETPDHPLTLEMIEHIIEYYFL